MIDSGSFRAQNQLFLTVCLFCCALMGALPAQAQKLLIPMDDSQSDHLRGYGVTYWVLDKTGTDVEWLLNYRSGSFLTEDLPEIRDRARTAGVTIEPVSDAKVAQIYAQIEEENMEKVLLDLGQVTADRDGIEAGENGFLDHLDARGPAAVDARRAHLGATRNRLDRGRVEPSFGQQFPRGGDHPAVDFRLARSSPRGSGHLVHRRLAYLVRPLTAG